MTKAATTKVSRRSEDEARDPRGRSSDRPLHTTRLMASTRSAVILAILYSAGLHHFLLPRLTADGAEDEQKLLSLPVLPLRHSAWPGALALIVYESLLIYSHHSPSLLSALGLCLHLLKLPLLATVYRYFRLGFSADICRSLGFDLLNYLGQLLLFHLLSPSSPPNPKTVTTTTTARISKEKTSLRLDPNEASSQTQEEEEEEEVVVLLNDPKEGGEETRNSMVISLLSYTLISLIDGLISFFLERPLNQRIHADLDDQLSKQTLDQYFLLQPSKIKGPTEILRLLRSRRMGDHQAQALLVNMPYIFSAAGWASLPSDFLLLDRLPLLSIHSKSLWLLALVARRLVYSAVSCFFKS
ncbi:uncharacterized protein PGTG_05413 [Puccinia graminis f. sp. tritici CRL 75-36-700-3]|uniref:Uncharacterized protein n=1 Tax=Puccinia graminis f. sp. tritici (strain CRL 75-36-700-3 / race SCCL) TaxID=418459 RepID=E3K482_PUCGT|nr:uncharacterized protein PGTG_05413 [Puccinia graminis f. sp. tritici CRL 75-36-700-3]EFP79092.1 hypothetical protein PGTG_05413 [Puccinia graminis f. sp. tritici CRL 75-36-700-3]